MVNLAGNKDCDSTIKVELNRARIPIHYLPKRTSNEVPYSIIGAIGKFEFRRAWYYYGVRGPVPINIAKILYDDPVGRDDIRVNGCSGNTEPNESEIIYRLDNSVKIAITKEEYDKGIDYFTNQFKNERALKEWIDKYEICEDFTKAKGYIESYHIDSEVGLRVFVDTLRYFNVI